MPGGVSGVGPAGSNALTDRPHTISSAYEKGHQRPQLTPYTFTPTTIEVRLLRHLVLV